MWNDLKRTFASLLRSRSLLLIATLLLGLGIGANTAFFSLLHQVAIRSLPIEDPLTLVSLDSDGKNYGWSSSDNRAAVFSYPMYEALRKDNQVLADIIGRTSAPATLVWGGEAERAAVEVVTANYFEIGRASCRERV